MKMTLLATTTLLLIAAPVAAEEAQRAAPAAQAATPVRAEAAPQHTTKRPPNWRRINHKLNKRAKNAIKNGARPKVIRKKLKAHKKKLYRRWKSSQK